MSKTTMPALHFLHPVSERVQSLVIAIRDMQDIAAQSSMLIGLPILPLAHEQANNLTLRELIPVVRSIRSINRAIRKITPAKKENREELEMRQRFAAETAKSSWGYFVLAAAEAIFSPRRLKQRGKLNRHILLWLFREQMEAAEDCYEIAGDDRVMEMIMATEFCLPY